MLAGWGQRLGVADRLQHQPVSGGPLLQVRVTGGIQQLLPSFLPGLLFGPPVPLERLVLDDERGILYSMAANNGLQVG